MAREREEFDPSIDELQLDKEWLKQPAFYSKWARKAADARFAYDQAKNEVELVKADLYYKISRSPDEFGLSKTTEAAIQNTITISDAYQDAVDVMMKAKHRVGVMDAAVQSLDQRKRALEKLVDLFLSDYFSAPRASGDNKNDVEEMEKKVIRRKHSRKRAEV